MPPAKSARNDRPAASGKPTRRKFRRKNGDDEDNNRDTENKAKNNPRAIVAKTNNIPIAATGQDTLAGPPTSVASRLSAQLVHVIEVLQLRSSWIPFLPYMVGLNTALGRSITFTPPNELLITRTPPIDSAIQTICHATHYNVLLLAGTDDLALRQKSFYHNGLTLTHLRSLIQSPAALSDFALATVCLLQWFELLVPSRTGGLAALSKHLTAFRAILLARPRTETPTPLSRAIVHTSVPFHFNYSTSSPAASDPAHRRCAPPDSEGMHALFEDPRWLEPVPGVVDTVPDCLLRIRRSALATYMRLPKLIPMVAGLRRGLHHHHELASQELPDLPFTHDPPIMTDESDWIDAAVRAEALLALEDRPAEDALLHAVKIRKTTAEEDAAVAPYAFEFRSEQWLLGAVNYWQTRMMVVQLVLSLDELWRERAATRRRERRGGGGDVGECGEENEGEEGEEDRSWLSDDRREKFIEDEARMAKNVIMSWQFVKEAYLPGRMQIVPALKVVLATLGSGRMKTTTSGVPAPDLAEWISKKIQGARKAAADNGSAGSDSGYGSIIDSGKSNPSTPSSSTRVAGMEGSVQMGLMGQCSEDEFPHAFSLSRTGNVTCAVVE